MYLVNIGNVAPTHEAPRAESTLTMNRRQSLKSVIMLLHVRNTVILLKLISCLTIHSSARCCPLNTKRLPEFSKVCLHYGKHGFQPLNSENRLQ